MGVIAAILPVFCVALLLIFLVLTRGGKNLAEHLLVWSFITPAIVLNIFQINQTDASGNSFKSSFIRIASTMVFPIIFLLLSYQFQRRIIEYTNRLKIFLASWFIIFFLEIIQVLFLKNKAVTFFGITSFFILFLIVVFFDLDFLSLARKSRDMGFLLALLTIAGYLTKFNFETSLVAGGGNTITVAGHVIDLSKYAGGASTASVNRFTPFNKILGINGRGSGFFTDGGPQEMGPYFGFIACLALIGPLKKFDYFKLAIIFIVGSTTGSRTFLEVFFVGLVVKLSISITQRVQTSNSWRFTLFTTFSLFLLAYNLISAVIAGITHAAVAQYGAAAATAATAQNIQSFSGRLPLWGFILNQWLNVFTPFQKLFGYGPQTLGPIAEAHFNQPAYGHAHNALLQYFWDFGILGGVCFLIIQFSVINLLFKKKKNIQMLILCLSLLSLQTEVFFTTNILVAPTMIFWWLATVAVFDSYTKRSTISEVVT